jgi:hypothetical protein
MDINRFVSNLQDVSAAAMQTAAEAVSQMNEAGKNEMLARVKDVFNFHEMSSAEFLQAQPAITTEAAFLDPISFFNNMSLYQNSSIVNELLPLLSNVRNQQTELNQLANNLAEVLRNVTQQPGTEFGILRDLRNAVGDLTGLYRQGTNQIFNQIAKREPHYPGGGVDYATRSLQEQLISRLPSSNSLPETHQSAQRFGSENNLPAYGSRGNTIAEGQWGLKFGEANFHAHGDWGEAYFRGENFIGARARVFGDVNWDNRNMQVGFEAEVGARAHYEAGYRTPNGPVGGEAGVAGDAFAGARASGNAELSLNENAPRVAVGAEMFEGARAGLDVGGGLGVDGNKLVGGHYGVEAWSGVGASINADLGLKDGNLRFDFSGGLALLIGAEVSFGFELGFGDAFRSIKKLGENVLNGLEKSAGAVAKEVGKAAENTVKTVVNAAGDAAKGAVNAAGGAVKAVGNFISSIF